MSKYQRIINRILPVNTRRRHYYELGLTGFKIILNDGWDAFFTRFKSWAGTGRKPLKNNNQELDQYHQWILLNEPDDRELRKQKKLSSSLKYQPEITIVVPVLNFDEPGLKSALQSVLNQTYSKWNLHLLIRDQSENAFIRKLVEKYIRKDSRINIHICPEIKQRSCIKKLAAEGGFVCIPENNIELAPFAFYEIADWLNKEPEADFIYSDEDMVSMDGGQRNAPNFKPDWSPDTLCSYNYIGNFFVIKNNLFAQVADNLKLNSFNSDESFELMLMATEKAGKIVHIPRILFHVKQQKIRPVYPGIADPEEYRDKFTRSVRWIPDGTGSSKYKFSLIILNRNKPEYIIPLIDALQKKGHNEYYEVLIGDTGTNDKTVLEYYRSIAAKIKVIPDLKYHFGSNYNYLISNHAQGELIGIMNNDIVLPGTSFLHDVEKTFTDSANVAVLGLKLIYPDGRLQHGGIYFFEDSSDNYCLPYHRLHGGNPTMLPEVKIEPVPAVTGAFMFVKKVDFISLQGFDDNYREEAQDVDYCLKCRRLRKEVLFLNTDSIIHIENGTREKGSENWNDRRYLLWKWESFLEAAILGTDLNRPVKKVTKL